MAFVCIVACFFAFIALQVIFLVRAISSQMFITVAIETFHIGREIVTFRRNMPSLIASEALNSMWLSAFLLDMTSTTTTKASHLGLLIR